MYKVLIAALLAVTACAKNIPNTEIRDTPDTRAILEVVDKYRAAVERRDAATVLALVSTSYFDNAGTADPSDDLDYARLKATLPNDYLKMPTIRIDLGVKQIEVEGEKAFALFFYDTNFRVTTPKGEVARRDSDQSRMTFRKEAGLWKITSGL